MKLSKYKDDYYEFSGLTSKLVTQFSFAGIAIIWIFKVDQPIQHLIPNELIIPLLCFVITLSLSLLQYLVPTIIWAIFFHYFENKFNGNTEREINAPSWFSIPGWIFFILKIISLHF